MEKLIPFFVSKFDNEGTNFEEKDTLLNWRIYYAEKHWTDILLHKYPQNTHDLFEDDMSDPDHCTIIAMMHTDSSW